MSVIADAKNDRYLELVIQFPLRPIRSDLDLDEAIRMVDSLVGRKNLFPEEEDYLDVLSDLIERYESDAYPMPPLSDAEMLNHLLEARGMSPTELAQAIGISPSTIGEVIAGRNSFNRNHLGKIARFFHVSPDVFAF
ncbi:MAG: helix-turn-helix domain-containing protein [Pirellulales bacterium]|nr:helix-turn-helix domain-containing protein [Pirellulales bacterium]